MPIYEFRCVDCKAEFEELCRLDERTVPCPSCGSRNVERKISLCAFSVGGKMTTTGSSGACSGCSATSCSSCSTSRR
jgi:putative FmdB family regulatory protein